MVIELSLLKNDVKEKLSIVILCAGEGTRLKKITKTVPKPLIKLEALNGISILHHTINTLINFVKQKILRNLFFLAPTANIHIHHEDSEHPTLTPAVEQDSPQPEHASICLVASVRARLAAWRKSSLRHV